MFAVWHQWLGIVGTIFILGAYFLLQMDRISSRDLSYSVMNAIGASFLVVSLLFDFNLSALIVEGFWAVISAVGIIRYIRSRTATQDIFQRNALEVRENESQKL
jgi:predicted membrane protein